MKHFNIKQSDIVLIIIIIILIISYLFIKIFTFKSEPILLDYAKRYSINTISNIINKCISEVLIEYDYEDIIEIEKDNNGIVENLNINNKIINEILYNSTKNILENINNLEKNNNLIFYVPIGVIHDMPILVNIGPKIPFKIDILGSINNETLTQIKEYGINSSMIEVYLSIDMQVQVILPFVSETIDINKKILLDSKVIQGQIPEYYGGLLSTLKK